MLVIRSIIFYPFYLLIMLVWVINMLLIAPLIKVKYRTNICYFYAKVYEAWLLLCCNIRVAYQYETPLMPEQNYVMMANHESSWEAYSLTTLIRPSTTILKKELLGIPLFGWALALISPISLQRSNLIQSMRRIFLKGQEKLQQGYSVLIFPQGTRSRLPTIGKFNLSAINLAFNSGYPLLLIAHNSGESLPVGKFLKYPGKLNVLISEPIEPAKHDKDKFRQLALTKMNEMLSKVHNNQIVFTD